MSKLKWSLAASVAALLATGCSDTVVNDFSDAKATAKVSFFVRDQFTGEILDSVKVTQIATDTIAEYSDSTGLAEFAKVKIGRYVYRFDKAGYVPVMYTAVIADLDGDVPRVPDLTLNVDLAQEGASVDGYVYKTDLDNNSTPVEGAVVELTLGSLAGFDWVTPIVSDTTDATGAYAFAALPEGVSYSINVRQMVDGEQIYVSTGSVTVAGVKAGESKQAGDLSVIPDGGALSVLSTNFWGTLVVTDESGIEINFSQPVDISRLRLNDITVTRGGDLVLIALEWTNENRSLTITPASGKWWMNSTHTLTISGDLVSVDGKSLGSIYTDSFMPSSATAIPSNASNLKCKTKGIDYSTSTLNLSWASSDDADGYYLFIKGGNDSAFVEYDTYNGNDTSAYIFESFFQDGKEVKFRLVAYNSYGVADINSAPEITLKDTVKPELNAVDAIADILDLGAFALDNGSNVADTIDLLGFSSIDFNEPMDTTIVPAVKSSSTKATIYWEWTDANSATLNVVIPANTDASGINSKFTIDITTLKDLAGNSITGVADDDKTFLFMDSSLLP